MAALTDFPLPEPPTPTDSSRFNYLWRKLTGKDRTPVPSPPATAPDSVPSRGPSPTSSLMRRFSKRVVPGLPRAKTFKRQQSEGRERLEPNKPSPAERRAVSVDRRLRPPRTVSAVRDPLPHASAPDFLIDTVLPPEKSQTALGGDKVAALDDSLPSHLGLPNEQRAETVAEANTTNNNVLPENQPHGVTAPAQEHAGDHQLMADARSDTTSQYDAAIQEELETRWILNLSMHFRDKSKREKFFVTFREKHDVWRRVTISLDYRNAPGDSLERDLLGTKYQREKSSKIYEAIRESLQDIQFYDTVTNLKLQTTDGRLHVHVVEDVNEIIAYPSLHTIQHLRCRRIMERDIEFDSHMSGFVYKVRVHGHTLIKKEIPGPDTVDEFLYEINALYALRNSRSIIDFYGVVVDEAHNVKGLLISFADKGALVDVIYDSQEHELDLPWATREKWAWQIVSGLADVHESGFVQGDFTLSNIVIDHHDDARIIDINRRGCPVGWEPPEATPLIDSNQRISMYIGVKSDLYQLGMVLWALATLEDEPEVHRRPLRLKPEIDVPGWYRSIVASCLSENPRDRWQASQLLDFFPEHPCEHHGLSKDTPAISVDDGHTFQQYAVGDFPSDDGYPHARMAAPIRGWQYAPYDENRPVSPAWSETPSYEPPRGRSPPSPLPSQSGMFGPSFTQGAWYSNHLGATAPLAQDGGEGQRAETPPEDLDLASAKREDPLKQEIEAIEANLHKESATEPAQTTGGESQEAEAMPPITQGNVDGGAISHGVQAFSPAISVDYSVEVPPVSVTEHEPDKAGGEDRRRDDCGQENTGDTEHTTDKATEPPPQPPSEDSGVALPDEDRLSLNESCGDLAGIGAAHDNDQGDPRSASPIRQMTCSDEDLGIVTTATTPKTTSPA